MRTFMARYMNSRSQQDRMSRMPTGAVVVSVDPRTNKLQWGGTRGRQPAPISHPYMGPTSWFRVCPEVQTKVIVSYRGEDLRPYVSSYTAEDIDGSTATTLVEATEGGKFYYRVLREGEMHAVSTGLAEVTWLQSGNLDLRGGAVSLKLRNDTLELVAASPTHRSMTLGSKVTNIGDEQRFGVITRPSPLDRTQQIVVKADGSFAKERLTSIKLDSLQVPAVDVREGVVVEDNGTVVSVNGNKLRFRAKYGTITGQFVQATIDETGNVLFSVPQCDVGLTVKTNVSDMKLDVGKNLNFVISQNWVAQARQVRVSADRIELAGTFRLATDGFSSTLQAASTILPVATPTLANLAATTNAIVAYLQTLAPGYNASLTTKTVAG